ncbi:MAG: DUF2807 domain-containing protein [Chthoniobacter sp.]|nr:DUF2807 domain-containing protein [Chthoniobacter sp.]
MKLPSFIRHFAAATLLGGCSVERIKGDGNITTDDRPLSEITSVQAAGAYSIEWSSGPPLLTITTDGNLLPHILTKVSGTTLKISSDTPISPTKGIKIVVTSPTIDQVDLSGAVQFTAAQVSGAAFSITAAGASTIELEGSVTSLAASLTGASHLKAGALKAKSATVTLVGASSGDVAVEESLNATITGAGALTYSGDPKSVEQQVTGAGSIHRRQ